MGQTGVGGYGGISTMNQDQRGGKYGPHRTVSRYLSHTLNVWWVNCLACGQKWDHSKDERTYPEHCSPPGEARRDDE
jgi:hypothetical protein